MKKRGVLALYGVLLTGLMCLPLTAAAEQSVEMDDVVVTATRTASATTGGTSVSVITAQEIAAKQLTTVEEVLKTTPGIDVVANGGLGTQSSVFIRGADSKNTLILVDGVMFNDPSGSNRGADLAHLTTDNIERIEIVRGPMSVLYGSNATAGVINIITKRGSGTPHAALSAEAGSYGTWKLSGNGSGAVGKAHYSIGVSRLESDGFSIANDDNSHIPHDGNTSEDDGYENTTVSGKFGVEISEDFEIVATLRYLDAEVDLDAWGPGYTGDRFGGWPDYAPQPNGKTDYHNETEEYLGRLDIKNRFFNDALTSDLYVQGSRHERDGYDNDGAQSYDYVGESREIGWQGSYRVNAANTLTVGGALFREEMESDSSGISKKDADTTSFWAQEQLRLGSSFELIAGVRYDDHDRFGDKTTYRLAPSYVTDFGLVLKASYGTGFRAPSLYELYSSYGSEDLDAEESEGWDVGFEQEFASANLLLGVTYFEQTFEDRIDFDMATYHYSQLPGDTETRGVETFVQWRPLEAVLLRLNYTYNDTQDPDGARLTRRALNKVNLTASYTQGPFGVNLDCRWVGERDAISSAADENGNSVSTLDAYTVVNLAARYDITEHLCLFGRVDNLFDEFYEEAWSYATPGLSGYAGVKVTF
jgi:vitamin B12 transporter